MTISRSTAPDISGLAISESSNTNGDSFVRSDLYEEKQTPEAGIGAFATKLIPSGTRIFCEASLVVLPDEAGHVELHTAVKALSAERQAAYWNLAASSKPAKNVVYAWIEDLREICGDDESHLFNSLVEEYELAWSIYETNRFTMKFPHHLPSNPNCPPSTSFSRPTTPSITTFPSPLPTYIPKLKKLGIFPLSARLNHSCSPNVFHRYNPKINRLTVHALRDIQPGEQLCTSYIDICHPTAARRQLLKHWGFRCRCTACDSPDTDEDFRRKKLEEGFSRLGNREKKRMKSGEKWDAKDWGRSLEVIERLVKGLEKEGMEETDTLGVVYTLGVRHLMMIESLGPKDGGERAKQAVEWMEKVVGIERKCLGEESFEFERAVELLRVVKEKMKI